MVRKKLTLLGMMLAGTGVPYFWNEPGAFDAVKSKVVSMWQSTPHVAAPGSHDYAAPALSGGSSWRNLFPSWGPTSTEPPAMAPNYDLEELLRFEVSPRWIIEKWPRVTTVLSDQDLEGLRTPVVTGVGLDDIAGVITYYFNKQHHVRRITLQGYTGDERKLVATLADKFGLQPEPTLGAGLYCNKWNGKPMSVLRIVHAPVVRASTPNSRLAVRLELNRDGGYTGLSGDFRQLLDYDRNLRRW